MPALNFRGDLSFFHAGCLPLRNQIMRRFITFLAFSVLVTPAWCGKRMTVGQLQELLHSFQQEKKSDAEIATALEQLELTEELTRSTMKNLVGMVQGPLSMEQIYVLEARSADLVPPRADLPDTPAPDETSKSAIIGRAEAYITKTYEQLPLLTATKTTLRFQDNTTALEASSGISGSAKDAVTSSGLSNPAVFVHYINTSARPVTIEHGTEKKATASDANHWGANGLIEFLNPEPGLSHVFKEAQSAGKIQWSRWESIDGTPAAVFSFDVPRQKSKLAINVCCFPDLRQAGIARFYSATSERQLAGSDASSGGGVAGNFQTTTEWHPFRTVVPYHGLLFLDPDTGIVRRMIINATLKPTDVVHQVDIRVDYARVTAGQSSLIVPIKSVMNSLVVPNGESGAGGYSTRTTLFTSQYSDYRPVPGK